MRASRLLQMLLLLQNRGRMSCGRLARELEVTRRTVLRDVDALTEAGLPIIVHRGNGGGVELGFNYRTRLTGLAADEAEALAVILSQPVPVLDQLGLRQAAGRAVSKITESFPDLVRGHMERARKAFQFQAAPEVELDPRLAALAEAVRQRCRITVNAHSAAAQVLHPAALRLGAQGWEIIDARKSVAAVALEAAGDINISAMHF